MAPCLDLDPLHPPAPDAFDAFVFDLDNTLMASEPYHVKGFAQAMRELANYDMTAQDAKDFIGDTSVALAAKIITRLGFRHITPQQVAARKAECTMAIFKAEPFPGACDFVHRHAGRQRLAVASNSPRPFVRQALQEIGLLESFDAIVTIEDVRERKPNPEMFLLTAERLGVQPHKCLIFEDSDIGLQAARAGDFPAVLVLNPGNPLPMAIPAGVLTMTWPQLLRWSAAPGSAEPQLRHPTIHRAPTTPRKAP